MTELEAVNLMLRAIGESPVNSLSSGNPDAEDAARTLDSVKRDVLSTGWHCNTRERITLVADAEGYVTPPGNVIEIDTVGQSARYDVILLGGKLYDRGNDTAKFPIGTRLLVDYTLNLEWDDLTYALQRYIACRAAREFQGGAISSTTLDGFTSRDEQLALANAKASDLQARDLNLLRQNPNIGARRRRYRR